MNSSWLVLLIDYSVYVTSSHVAFSSIHVNWSRESTKPNFPILSQWYTSWWTWCFPWHNLRYDCSKSWLSMEIETHSSPGVGTWRIHLNNDSAWSMTLPSCKTTARTQTRKGVKVSWGESFRRRHKEAGGWKCSMSRKTGSKGPFRWDIMSKTQCSGLRIHLTLYQNMHILSHWVTVVFNVVNVGVSGTYIPQVWFSTSPALNARQ